MTDLGGEDWNITHAAAKILLMPARTALPSNDPGGPFPWLPDLAKAVQNIDNETCPRLLTQAIRKIVDAQFAMVLIYRVDAQPIHLWDTFTSDRQRHGLANYIENTFVLNPVYIAAQSGLAGGVYRVSDLAPDDYLQSGHYRSLGITLSDSEALGYITDNWPRGMDEIAVIVELPDDVIAEISLIRSPNAMGRFTDGEICALDSLTPLISAVFSGYWEKSGIRSGAMPKSSGKEQAFKSFGKGILSPREREVAQLILRGHSGHSISENLGISITTVKTHRKKLYAKLGIATQFELFSLFLAEI